MPHSTDLEQSYNQTKEMLLVTPSWQSQIWYPPSTRNVYSSSTAASKEYKVKKTTRRSSSSNCKQNITTSGVDILSWKDYLRREFQEQLPNLLQVQDEKVKSQITICPG